MSNRLTKFLGGVKQGLLTPKGQMANWQHATRIFVDNNYRFAPRTKFLFYVYFDIDYSVITNDKFKNQHRNNESGILVKRADLPKFQFETETVNQYNRKKIVYKMINYNAVNISLHDDSDGIVNALWALYYSHYVADMRTSNQRGTFPTGHLGTYIPTETPSSVARYGLDNNYRTPFLRTVSIYTMTRGTFSCYTLINPRITQWSHGEVDYSLGNETVESQMTLEYEAVFYKTGTVGIGRPDGFAELRYDVTPSPLSALGGGTETLFGPGGVAGGFLDVFGSVTSGDFLSSPGNFIGTAISAVNTYNNIRNLNSSAIRNELTNVAVGAVSSVAVGAVFNALGNISFPGSETQDITEASASTLASTGSTTSAAPQGIPVRLTPELPVETLP